MVTGEDSAHPARRRRAAWRLPMAAFAALVFAFAGLAAARAQDPVAVQIIEVDDSGFPTVRAVVSVLDATGRPVAGLTAASFSTIETGVPGRVTAVEPFFNQQLRLAVILTIDISGSMAGQPIIQARNAAIAFVDTLQPEDQVAVISFGTRVVVEKGLDADQNAARAAIGRLQVLGNTALYGAVGESVNVAVRASLSRRAIVLLSDGFDFGGASAISRAESLRLAQEANVPIYVIGLGADIDRPYLQQLAATTGGAYLEAPTAARVPAIYAEISELLRRQYILTIQSSAEANVEARSLTVRASTAGGSAEGTTSYQTRRTIAQPTGRPPSAPTPQPAPESPAEEPEGSSIGTLLFAAIVGVVAVGGIAGLVVRQIRQRRLEAELSAMSQRAVLDVAGVATAEEQPAAPPFPIRLVMVGGSSDGLVRPIRSEPLRIGSSADCEVRLEGPGVAPEHVRVWWRSGRLMFHRVADRPAYVSGRDVDWAVLDIGDTIEIGPYRMRIDADEPV